MFVSGAPPNAQGLLIVGSSTELASTGPGGLPQWVSAPRAQIAVATDEYGWLELPWTLPAPGARFAFQVFFQNTAACPGEQAWSSTQAIEVTVQ